MYGEGVEVRTLLGREEDEALSADQLHVQVGVVIVVEVICDRSTRCAQRAATDGGQR